MHVEVPKSHSFKEFAGEYVMIVVSIITALALENGVHRYHQNHRAHEASRNIEAELTANLTDLRSVIKQNDAQLAKTTQMRDILLAGIEARAPDKDAIENAIKKAGGQFGIVMVTPSFQHEAWDVAVANQSLTWVETDRLKQYATQYSGMRDVQTVLANRGTSFVDHTQVAAAFASLKLKEYNARDTYRVLTQISATHDATNSLLKELERALTQAQQKTAKLAH